MREGHSNEVVIREYSTPLTLVVVDRARTGWLPDYPVHGRATCLRCGNWCLLDSETYRAVLGGAAPLCLDCATRLEHDGTLGAHNLIDPSTAKHDMPATAADGPAVRKPGGS